MTNKDIQKIIKQEGFGNYLGKFKTYLGEIEAYESYIQIYLTNGNQYSVELLTNPLFPKYFQKCLYKGNNKNKAEEISREILEKDKINKENKTYEKLGRN